MRSFGASFGRFVQADSLVHRLDPRCKILCLVAVLGGLFAGTVPSAFILWCLFLLVLCAISKLSVGAVLRSARSVRALVVITFVLDLFWTPGRELVSVGPLSVTAEGLIMAAALSLRLCLLVIFAGLLMMTTSPMAFSDGLERLFSPLRRIGLPTSEFAMMMTIALRFIPTLFEETDRIVRAQLSRGADLESGGPIRRARAFLPILVPLFVLVFRRAETLASAMESRCYVPGAARSRLHPLAWTRRDTAALLVTCAFTVAAVAAGRAAAALLPF